MLMRLCLCVYTVSVCCICVTRVQAELCLCLVVGSQASVGATEGVPRALFVDGEYVCSGAICAECSAVEQD